MTVGNANMHNWAATIEAVIFASDKPVRETELRNHIPDNVELAPLIATIHKRFDETSGIELCQVGDSYPPLGTTRSRLFRQSAYEWWQSAVPVQHYPGYGCATRSLVPACPMRI